MLTVRLPVLIACPSLRTVRLRMLTDRFSMLTTCFFPLTG